MYGERRAATRANPFQRNKSGERQALLPPESGNIAALVRPIGLLCPIRLIRPIGLIGLICPIGPIGLLCPIRLIRPIGLIGLICPIGPIGLIRPIGLY